MRPGLVAAPRTAGPAFVGLLVLLGFLLATGIVQERLREQELPSRAAELRSLVDERRRAVEDLSAEAGALTERVADLQRSAAEGSREVRLALEELERLRTTSGLGAVTGPGLIVVLEDSSRVPQSAEEHTDLRIQDVDIQLVVNAMWQAGAEAISVNGQRVVSTTAIRRAGGSILVNYRAVDSPYRVAAIGDADALRDGLEEGGVVRRYEVWREVYGLGFSVQASSGLVVPALAAGPDLRWARPVGE
jgi:uncharacterized protein YlxW (UPF0749 family)